MAKSQNDNSGSVDAEKETVDQRLARTLPKQLAPTFKKIKSLAARADFLGELDKMRLEAQKAFKVLDDFQGALEEWFIQNLPVSDATGTAGKDTRVEIKKKPYAKVEDWNKFYAHIKKTGSFELLNRAPNAKAMKERWEAGKQVPGVVKEETKVVSITKVK